jgi:iron complex transport system substrate-binding protein
MTRMIPRAIPNRISVLAAGTLALLVASAHATNVTDARGRLVEVKDAERIVSVGGAVTEILYALGLDGRIVAVDSTSRYPERALQDKKNVGYMRQLSPEGVLGLAPSLILAAEGAGPREAVAVLEAAGVPFVLVPDRFTGPGILDKIRVVAAATATDKQGECLAGAVAADLDALASLRQRVERPAKVLFVLSLANDRPLVAGRATAADGIIGLAGAVNAVTEHEGYKLLTDESIVAAQPDSILVMQRGSEDLTAETVFARPAFATTPARARNGFIAMEAHYLLGFGPRTAQAARDLAHALYPALATEKLPSERDGGCGR